MPNLRRAIAPTFPVLVLATAGGAMADEPPPLKTAQPAETARPTETARPVKTTPSVEMLQPVAPPGRPLQVASDPPEEHAPAPPPAPGPPRVSDGAGPRITFGRTWTDTLNDGFYGRFETEYFEVKGWTITGALLGLEGWGTEGATAGGGSIHLSAFGGVRGGPFKGPKAPVFFLTAGAGVHVIMHDRIGDADGFGLLSPFAVATAGMEIISGIRLLCDGRILYRWHWTAESHSQFQLGLTLGLNSYLWDGPWHRSASLVRRVRLLTRAVPSVSSPRGKARRRGARASCRGPRRAWRSCRRRASAGRSRTGSS